MTNPLFGIGIKNHHLNDFFEAPEKLDFVEVHTENYLVDGGINLQIIHDIAKIKPISFHGVGLSLGTNHDLFKGHLDRLKNFFDNLDHVPFLVSEHISWSSHGPHYYNDLLPLVYDDAALDVICKNIDLFQQKIGHRILVENPSSYMMFEQSTMSEPAFINKILEKTGCGLLLDINNIDVSCLNHDWSHTAYLDEILSQNAQNIGEIHIAGHDIVMIGDQELRVDDHSQEPKEKIMEWIPNILLRIHEGSGSEKEAIPILLEWDTNTPDYSVMTHLIDHYRTGIFTNKKAT